MSTEEMIATEPKDMTPKRKKASPEQEKLPEYVRVIADPVKSNKKINLQYLRDKKRQKVRGIFRFTECPGGVLEFVYKEFKEDPIECYSLVDGQIYELPLGVVQHIKKNMLYPVYEYLKTEPGVQMTCSSGNDRRPTMYKIQRWTARANFESLEFLDDEDLDINRKVLVEASEVSIIR